MSNRRRISLACVSLLVICATTVAIGLGSAGAAAGAPAEDHLVVTDIPFLETAQAVKLERFSGTGVTVGHSWPLPTVASGSNHPFTLQGGSNAVGALALSADKRYVSLAGYTTAVGGSAGAAEPRDVARVNAVGTADTSTTLGLTFEKENIRGAVTKDGTSFWVTGNGNGTGTPQGGLIYAPLGNSTTPTVIFSKTVPTTNSNKALNNTRSIQLVGGSLYTGSEKGTAGVYKVTGTPTTAQAPTNLIAWTEGEDAISELPLESTPESGEVNLMYVAKETVGIFKYALEGSTWTSKGEVAAGEFGPLTGEVDPEGHFRIYAIKGKEAANEVVTTTDTAAFNAAPVAATPTVVKVATAGTAFRGIAFAPEDPTLEAEAPGEPTGVTGVGGNQKVELSWTAPTAHGASAITEYVITPFVGGVAQAPIKTGSAATSHTVEGLTNGTAYTFTVAAVNSAGPGPASASSAPITPETPGAPTPTIHLAAEHLEGTNSDPTNPTDSVEVAQGTAPSTALTVEVTASTNPAVAAVSGVAVSGTGATRTVSVTPAGGVGYAEITLKVTGEEGKSATTVLKYAASAAAPNPSNARFYTGAADASTAISVGEGYVLVGDDENNTIRLYKRSVSGAPVKEWDFDSQMGNPEEIDIEASARVGETIYWTGSMGNSKSGNLKPDRSTLFTTHITGTGANTELTFDGYYKGLRQDLIGWDEAHANRFGFAAGAASGQIPKEINGFNVEGLEFAPGSETTAYVGFRAPLSPATAGGDAILVPVTNMNELAPSGDNTTAHATFGEPILMNLGGLSIREIRKNAFNEYLIIAGSYAAGGEFALYTWDGVAADAPVRALTALPAETGSGEDPGSWESIVEVPHPLATGDEVQLVMDNGSTDFYGDGAEAKTLPAEWEKDRTETFTLELPVAPVDTTAPTITGEVLVGSTLTCHTGTWTGTPTPTFGYEWLREGTPISGATESTYVTATADAGQAVGCEVTATNTGGSASETSSNTIEPATTPVNTVAPTVTGQVPVGSTLTCHPGTWTGTPSPTFGYEWLREGTPISGATESTYTTVAADAGKAIGCKVTATNTGGSASTTSSNTIQPASSVVNTAAPTVTGEIPVGSTLTCHPGTWTGTPSPTFGYEWLREGAPISAATEATYVTATADAGKAIGCKVTATNTGGSASMTSSNTIQPATIPADTAAPVASGEATVGSILSCSTGTWNGTPAPSLSYEWLREGVAIGGATASTYTTTAADVGKAVSCKVTATNDAGSRSATSNSITVIEAAHSGTGGTGGSSGSSGGSSGGGGSGGSPTPSVSTPNGPVTPKGDQAAVGMLSCGSSTCTVTESSAVLKIGGKSVKVKVKIPTKIAAHGSAPLKIILPKGLKEELAGKTVTARIKVKVKNAAGATIDKTITVRIKMKAAH